MKTSIIQKELQIYGLNATPEFCKSVNAYTALLLRWNQRISLTTVTDPAEILQFHFGESLFAASAVPLRDGRLADVGSGAGFPGLPLKMANPNLKLTLIESNAKKAAFLSEVVRELNLDVKVFRGRMSDMEPNSPTFDFITARALGQFDELLEWSSRILKPSGKLVLWIGKEDAGVISKSSSWVWGIPIQIPNSRRRFLLVGTPKT
ncbi:MAG: 16S rRNA (guanine(527)-N(7))-methyltransferase RsmG [Candidatus Acidiferrales bacterium]